MRGRNIILIFLALFLLFGCSRSEDTITIGAVLPLTGSAAVWGENARMGIELALEEINEKNGVQNKKLHVIFEDSQSEPSLSVSAFRKLISDHNVPVVIGDIASSSVLAMAPVANRNNVVLLSPGASNPDISYAGDYVFRNWQSDALEGEVGAEFAFAQGYRNVATLYVNNAYGQGLRSVFEKSFTELGGSVLVSESFEQGATDIRSQLSRINNRNPDLIYMPGYPPEMAIALRQAKELGINFQFLSVQAFHDPTILELAGEATENVIFSIPEPPDSNSTVVSNFLNNYRNRFNREPGVTSDTGYDALKIISMLLNEIDNISGTEIKLALRNVSGYEGAAGITTFNEFGDVIRDFTFLKVENIQFKKIDD